MIRCQACAHSPERGALCKVGRRHATAHPRECEQFVMGAPAVDRIRVQACTEHRRGDFSEYRVLLHRAHREHDNWMAST